MLEEVNTYTAVCRRSGNWWAISVRELKGLHTQARRLDQVADLARDAVALMLDVDPDQIEMSVERISQITSKSQAKAHPNAA